MPDLETTILNPSTAPNPLGAYFHSVNVSPGKDYPPNTLLIISGLIHEEFKVEIKAMAALP